MITNIYEEATKTMPETEIDNHCSDLYLKKTETSTVLVNDYEFKDNVTTFISPIDKQRWYDVPFAFTPYFSRTIIPL